LEKHPVPMLAAEFFKGKFRKNPESGVLAGSSSDFQLMPGVKRQKKGSVS